MKNHRGYSLTELIAAMSVGTVILGLATGTVHRAMRLSSQAHDYHRVHQVALRLSDHFRRDVHRAESISYRNEVDSPVSMDLSVPRQKDIVYRVEGSRVLRQQSLGEQQNSEVYDFPNGYAISFAQPQTGYVELLVESDAKLPGVPPKTVLHINPEIGRYSRLAQVEEATP